MFRQCKRQDTYLVGSRKRRCSPHRNDGKKKDLEVQPDLLLQSSSRCRKRADCIGCYCLQKRKTKQRPSMCAHSFGFKEAYKILVATGL